jgi:hypothetical protein
MDWLSETDTSKEEEKPGQGNQSPKDEDTPEMRRRA